MNQLLSIGEAVAANACLYPNKIGARDLERSLTFRQWNERSCRLANGLLGLGLKKGDRVGILAYNCLEWMELYVAFAKAGLVAVPINFRLMGLEIQYILENCEARGLVVQDDLVERVDQIRVNLAIDEKHYVHFGGKTTPAGYMAYERTIQSGSANEPAVRVRPEEAWAFMYTSGTTGKPKGAIRTHGGSAALALVTALNQGFSSEDTGLVVMPLCHSNSLWYATLLAFCGATTVVYSRTSFDPEHMLKTFSEEQISFTSLVPTHYIMMLGLSAAIKGKYRAESVNKLLISSAPARPDTKLAIMEHFTNSKLLEAYGSTEAGWVTLLRPEEQLKKTGSIGKELSFTRRIRLLDENGNDVPDGEVGELYSCTPYAFDGYWKLPEKTAEAFRGEFLSVGDMARRDEEGFYYLADRKSNMIISGGENVYPSEVEGLLGTHPKIKDVAVIGIPDDKWGEAVQAVVVLHDRQTATEAEILEWAKDRIAGYKRPRVISFIKEEEMPRTATGKILHRTLKANYTK